MQGGFAACSATMIIDFRSRIYNTLQCMDDLLTNEKHVRPSTIEGIFYPDQREVLSARLIDLLNHTDEPAEAARSPFSIIVPHAALDYCGEIAAAAYRTVADRPIDTVVLLGPVHREMEPFVLLPQSQKFQTPLGDAEVDEISLKKLAALSPAFRIDDIPHLEEHCLEAQLPFVQHLFPQARILPILLGKPSRTLVEALSDSLWVLFEKRISSTLFVVTANMTSNADETHGNREAEQVIDWIVRGEWQLLMEAAESRRISSCGAGCLAAILLFNQKLGGEVEIRRQGSSLPLVGDPKKVVHYAAFVIRNR
jgi:AmmeMemoRadiSam system protein B